MLNRRKWQSDSIFFELKTVGVFQIYLLIYANISAWLDRCDDGCEWRPPGLCQVSGGEGCGPQPENQCKRIKKGTFYVFVKCFVIW